MSFSLFVRELKRLLPLSLAALLVPGFIYLAIAVLRETELRASLPELVETRMLALALALLIAPWIVGAAAFAPERESGAASFLARLPLSAWKLLAIRTSAAAVAIAAVHVPVWGLGFAFEFPRDGRAFLGVWTLGSGALLVGAWYCSLSLKRSLSAFAAAPVLVWGTGVALSLPWIGAGIRLPEPYALGLAGVLGVAVFLGVVWASQAQRPLSGLHPIRATWKPLAALLLLNASLAGGAVVADRANTTPYMNQAIAQGGAKAQGTTVYWYTAIRGGLQDSQVVLSREGQVAWLPKGHHLAGLSDRAAYTYVGRPRSYVPGGFVWPLESLNWTSPSSPELTPPEVARKTRERGFTNYMGPGKLGHFPQGMVWADEVPCQVSESWLSPADSNTELDLPEGWTMRAGVGSFLVARTSAGELRTFDLTLARLPLLSQESEWSDPSLLFPALTSIEDLLPSPSGCTLLALGRDPQGRAVAGLDLREAEPKPEVFFRLQETGRDPDWFQSGPFSFGVESGGSGLADRKVWRPEPTVDLPSSHLLAGEGEGYFFRGDELHFGTSSTSVPVDIP